MLLLGQQAPQSSKFSVTMAVRDKKGRPTGQVRTFHTDSAEKLSNFYERNKFRKKKREKNLPTKEEADKLLADAATFAAFVKTTKRPTTVSE